MESSVKKLLYKVKNWNDTWLQMNWWYIQGWIKCKNVQTDPYLKLKILPLPNAHVIPTLFLVDHMTSYTKGNQVFD